MSMRSGNAPYSATCFTCPGVVSGGADFPGKPVPRPMAGEAMPDVADARGGSREPRIMELDSVPGLMVFDLPGAAMSAGNAARAGHNQGRGGTAGAGHDL